MVVLTIFLQRRMTGALCLDLKVLLLHRSKATPRSLHAVSEKEFNSKKKRTLLLQRRAVISVCKQQLAASCRTQLLDISGQAFFI